MLARWPLAGILIVAMAIAGPGAAARGIDGQGPSRPSAYQLAVQLPGRIRKGEPASLVLNVRESGRPVDGVAACLVPAPLFASEEDAIDTTPAIGSDLGTAAGPGAPAGCVGAIAAVHTAPGVYQFTWEPDTAGRVNLRFTAGDSQLIQAVNVSSPPANAAILMAFAFLVAAILGAAAHLRRAQKRQGDLT